ncbi:hypothetical protein FBU30_005449 [Linnemannia zychae]|nr:hypothetical protein FBU30_005449 [Linnemannia zychae]
MAVIIASALAAASVFPKVEPTSTGAPSTLSIDIPGKARAALEYASAYSPPSTPSLLSASSDSAFEDGDDILEVVMCEKEKSRRRSQEFFFPRQTRFESAVPEVIRAKDVVLKDHPVVKDAYAEYERLYNADSVMTKDGRHMVRLL